MGARQSPLGGYLRARRNVVMPEDVGLTREPGRRVVGLRREEVADLAGISSDYYLRLEQGHDHQPSAQVLMALGRALRLDEHAMEYMLRISGPELRPPAASRTPLIDDNVLTLLNQWSQTPSFVIDRNQDVLAANTLARSMGEGFISPGKNLVVRVFSERFKSITPGWERFALDTVAALRFNSDRTNKRLQEIVGKLSMESADFRAMWARHDARPFNSGSIGTLIDGIGVVEFHYQNLAIPGHDGYVLSTFFGDKGTDALAALTHLMSRMPGEGATDGADTEPELTLSAVDAEHA